MNDKVQKNTVKKNWALGALLVAFVALLYFITIAKISGGN